MRCSCKRLIGCLLPAILAGRLAAQGSGDKVAGQQIFNSTCAACHGLDGQGGEHAPNIASEPNIQRKSEAEIAGIVRKGIPGTGMPAFGGSLDDRAIGSVVKYLRSLQENKGASTVAGDAVQGHALFFGQAHCADCHSVGGKGGFLGTDLSSYGRNRSAAAIRASILDPDVSRNARHGTATLMTRSGEKYTGVVRNEDNFSVQLQTVDGAFHFLDKSDLVRIERHPKSLGHANEEHILTSKQVDDLVAFLAKADGARMSENDNDEEQ